MLQKHYAYVSFCYGTDVSYRGAVNARTLGQWFESVTICGRQSVTALRVASSATIEYEQLH